MQPEYDVIILGGGCAGLSLGMRLAKSGADSPRTLILERRNEYTNDRTWCFWDDGSSPMCHLASHKWQSMTIRAASRSLTVNCGQTPYHLIPAASFYSEALEAIRTSSMVKLVTGSVPMREPYKQGREWRVDTEDGSYRAKAIVDTRPGPRPTAGGAMLWQSFHGQEIECNAPAFDPKRMDLMDFSLSNRERIRFTYVLPVSAHRALIEVTVLSQQPVNYGELSAELAIAVSRHAQGAPFSVLREEHGILPMGQSRSERGADPTYVRAGLAGGAARPSTGYAFQRIQRWADLCCAQLIAGKWPAGHAADPPLLRALDHLFLSVLRSRPEEAPSLFLALFEKTSTPRMIRFLSDRANALDYASVVWALPFLLFIQEIPRALMTQAGQPQESPIA